MQWYDWHTVTERLQGRAYALTRGQPYRVILDTSISTGCCDFSDRKIVINPSMFSDVFERMGINGRSLDKANFLVSRAVTGHEALHVLYSDPQTVIEAATDSPLLKTVLNLLEDARIERIGAMTSHVSKTLFRFVNGTAVRELPAFQDTALSDKLSGLSLLLRWRLGTNVPALEANAQSVWDQVHKLAEKALCAGTCNDVLTTAREILRILGLDKEENPKLPDDVQDMANRMQSEATGSRTSSPLPSPLTDSSPGNQSQEETNQDESADRDETKEQADGTATDTHRESQDGKQDTEEQSLSAHTSPSPSENDPSDIERLIDETAAQVSEDLDSIVPPGDDPNLVAKAKSFRGRPYADIVASPYAHYLPQAVPIATELIRELKADGPRAVSGSSEYPGRFKARYFVRDSAKPFALERFQGLTVPKMALTLIIDRSGSMEDIVYELRTMSMAVTMACENLQIPLSIWALEGQVNIKRFDEHGPQVLAKIAGIQANTLTRVMPTINDAVSDLKSRPEELKQIVLIHDGMPADKTTFVSWRKELRGMGLFCMYISSELAYESYQKNPRPLRQSMEELVGPQNYAVAPVTGIAKHWCSFIRGKRNSYARPGL